MSLSSQHLASSGRHNVRDGDDLRIEEFREILVRQKEVAVGVVAQYTIMPLLGYGIAEALKVQIFQHPSILSCEYSSYL